MKSIFTLLFALLVSLHGVAQIPNWVWATSAGGSDMDYCSSITTDPAGNVIVAGYFMSPSLTIGSTTLTQNGFSDMFLAKYDANGNILWGKNIGGTDTFFSQYYVSSDASGNIYVCGTFTGASITIGTTTLTNTNAQNNDSFVAKYDPNGSAMWAKQITGDGGTHTRGCQVDPSGNLLVTGDFWSDTVRFSPTKYLKNFKSGLGDIFIAKYDPSGNVLWATGLGGSSYEMSSSITSDASGNCYVAGVFTSTSILFAGSTLYNSSMGDMFFAKLDPSGNALWAKQSVGNSTWNYGPTSIKANASGDIYFSGFYNDSFIIFGADTLKNSGPQNTSDIFLAKYDASGNELWAKSEGDSLDDRATGSAIDALGNLLVTGTFSDSTLTLGNTVLNNNGYPYDDIFLAAYDASGNPQWAKSAGGIFPDSAACITVDAFNNIYIAGGFYSPSIVFGFQNLTNSFWWSDLFIAKLSLPTAIEENAINKGLSIAPNPFSSQTTLRTDELMNAATLTIYNSVGEQVRQLENISGQSITLQRNNLPPGLYYLTISENGILSTGKFIVAGN